MPDKGSAHACVYEQVGCDPQVSVESDGTCCGGSGVPWIVYLLSKEVAAGEHPFEMPNSHSLVVGGFGELNFILLEMKSLGLHYPGEEGQGDRQLA